MKNIGVFILAMVIGGGLNSTLKAQDMNKELEKRQQKIATIAINTATGNLVALKSELAGGLETGLTVNEINEILIQMYAYCGFPRSLQGINTFMVLVEERKAQGINDPAGAEAVAVTGTDKYAQGKQTLEELTQRHEAAPAGANAFAPGIDTFLKEHLFADIFGRGVLTYSERELATISALIGLGGVDPMLQAHLNMGMNTGLTEKQLQQAIEAVEPFAGTDNVQNARQILSRVVESRK